MKTKADGKARPRARKRLNPDTALQSLQAEWRRRLKRHGFDDIEDVRGNLKNDGDRRSIAFDNRELIFNFFYQLDHWITAHPEIPKLHRKILELYSEGKYVSHIARTVHVGRTTVHAIIKQYRRIVLGIN